MARSTTTRSDLVAVALRLFREEGYQGTTMRKIADGAGVSLGNAYYYFDGKDDLVHELYKVIQEDHRRVALPRMKKNATLAANFSAVLHTGLDTMEPYHAFGKNFLSVALPSGSESSPFSTRSAEARTMAIDLMRDTVAMSKHTGPSSLGNTVPTLLWMVYMGVTLHWVTDSSENCSRTRTLVDGVVPIIGSALRLARLPVARGLIADIGKLVEKISTPEEASS